MSYSHRKSTSRRDHDHDHDPEEEEGDMSEWEVEHSLATERKIMDERKRKEEEKKKGRHGKKKDEFNKLGVAFDIGVFGLAVAAMAAGAGARQHTK